MHKSFSEIKAHRRRQKFIKEMEHKLNRKIAYDGSDRDTADEHITYYDQLRKQWHIKPFNKIQLG